MNTEIVGTFGPTVLGAIDRLTRQIEPLEAERLFLVAVAAEAAGHKLPERWTAAWDEHGNYTITAAPPQEEASGGG